MTRVHAAPARNTRTATGAIYKIYKYVILNTIKNKIKWEK